MKLIILLALVNFSVHAQRLSAEAVSYQKISADRFWGVDAYENLYYSTDNVLFKFNKEQDSILHKFNDFNLGNLTSVDLINPLKIVLFYQDSNTVVFLDNRLNERNRFSFNQIQPLRTLSQARLAGNRHLWLFNIDTQRIEVFDYIDKETTKQSLPINSNINQFVTSFIKTWVVLTDELRVYDWYANQIKTISKSFDQIAVHKHQVVGLSASGNYFYKEKGKDFIKLSNLKQDSESFYLMNQKLYIYQQNKLSIYQITQKP